jgi:hypothetical protein
MLSKNIVTFKRLYTVNKLLFTATLFRDSSVITWFATSNFRDRAFFIHTELLIHLVRDEKCLRQWGSRKPHEIFSIANKSWFTVYIQKSSRTWDVGHQVGQCCHSMFWCRDPVPSYKPRATIHGVSLYSLLADQANFSWVYHKLNAFHWFQLMLASPVKTSFTTLLIKKSVNNCIL